MAKPVNANAAKKTCPRGHPYTGRNLMLWKDGRRRCRLCELERKRRAGDDRQVTHYRITIDTIKEADGRWAAAWHYEVGPCRGGPCGTTPYCADEDEAVAAAMGQMVYDMVTTRGEATDGKA